MCAESHKVNSGFGLYTREILSRLYKTDKYELAELSCYNGGDQVKTVPWKVYPNAPSSSDKDEDKNAYNSNHTNAFGQWRFDKAVLDFRPDIVFDIRDYWMFAYQELSPLRPYFHWIVAPTVDSLPQKNSWLHTFRNADMVLGHTDWAVDYLKNINQNIVVGPSVSDSVDPDIFKPINHGLMYHKASHLVPDGSFIIGAVMRNQKRKLIPNLFNVIKRLIQFTRNSKIYLYLHTSYPEGSGWDIPELLQEYGVYNNVLFTYYCRACKKAYANTYKGTQAICPFCNNKTSGLPNVVDGLTAEQLAGIYNLFDFFVQYAICEGLGIPQLEAAACGVPICSVDYSAMSEVTTKLDGYKVEYALFKELETGAFRALPNDSALVQIIHDYMSLNDEQKDKIKTRTRDNIIANYSWDKTAERYVEIFDQFEPKNIWDKPMVCNQSLQVSSNLSNRDFVKTIIKEVIGDDHLWNTNFAQEIIRNLDYGFVVNNGTVLNYSKHDVIKLLEMYLNNKLTFEKVRSGEIVLNDNFIKYANT